MYFVSATKEPQKKKNSSITVTKRLLDSTSQNGSNSKMAKKDIITNTSKKNFLISIFYGKEFRLKNQL